MELTKIMDNNYNCKNKFECDECSIKGICSLSPVAAAMKAVIFAFLQELAFYILKIRAFGGRNEQIKNNFIEIFSILISNSEYTKESLNNIVDNILETLAQVKKLYQDLCIQNNTSVKYYKIQVRLNKDFTIANIVKQGHKYLNKLKQNFTEEQSNGFDVVLIVLKSICLYMVELQALGVDIDNYYLELLSAVETNVFEEITQDKLTEHIRTVAKYDYELVKLLFKTKQEKYGKFTPTDVLISHREGKAILIAGHDMKEMELLLEATKDKGIDIYTHGKMIIAHTLPKFKAYPHLVGHYGKGIDSYMADFSSFPGVVFLTKLSLFKVESLYRGGIFTSDKLVASGISKIKDYDFEPLIKSALLADGFEETSLHETINIGFCEEELDKKFNAFIEKIKSKEIKNIFIVGIPDKVNLHKEYLEKLYNLIGQDSFVFSFANIKDKDNIIFVNGYYSCPLIYKLLDLISPLKESFDFKINTLFSRCEPHVISTIINQKNFGVDKTFFGECPPNLFNPAIIDYIFDKFGLFKYTTPEADYKAMIEG